MAFVNGKKYHLQILQMDDNWWYPYLWNRSPMLPCSSLNDLRPVTATKHPPCNKGSQNRRSMSSRQHLHHKAHLQSKRIQKQQKHTNMDKTWATCCQNCQMQIQNFNIFNHLQSELETLDSAWKDSAQSLMRTFGRTSRRHPEVNVRKNAETVRSSPVSEI